MSERVAAADRERVQVIMSEWHVDEEAAWIIFRLERGDPNPGDLIDEDAAPPAEEQ